MPHLGSERYLARSRTSGVLNTACHFSANIIPDTIHNIRLHNKLDDSIINVYPWLCLCYDLVSTIIIAQLENISENNCNAPTVYCTVHSFYYYNKDIIFKSDENYLSDISE